MLARIAPRTGVATAALVVLLPLLLHCAAHERARPLPPPGVVRAATIAPATDVVLVPDPALQKLVDPYPAPHGPSWLGGDVATSVRIADDRWIWIFGDTLLGELRDDCPHDRAYCDRSVTGPGAGMIANSAGTMVRFGDGSLSPVVKYWRSDAQGVPTPVFTAPGDGFLWPLAGARVGQVLLVAANRHTFESGLAPVDNFLLRVWNPDAPPDLWLYDVHPLDGFRPGGEGGASLSWTAALVVLGDDAYLFGSRGVGLDATTVLARMDVADASASDWSPRLHYLLATREGGVVEWSDTLDEARLHEIPGLPGTSEATIDAAPGAGWYTFRIPALGYDIRLYTADDLLGPWHDRGVAYEVPAEWRATRGDCPDPEAARAAAEGGPVEPACEPRYAAYAPKSHPELASPSGFAVSYNVNTWGGGLDAAVQALETLPGFYVPQLVATPP